MRASCPLLLACRFGTTLSMTPEISGTVQLFGSRLSPFVEKVARALQLKRIPYELVPPKSPTDFRRWNPQTGKMPVLALGGRRLYDSTLILRALDETVPTPSLVDPDPHVAARQHFLEDWADESLYWYGMGLRWADVNADATAAQVAGSLPLPAFLLPLAKVFLKRQIRPSALAQGLARLPLDVLLGELACRLDELLVWLGDRPFFFAERPSVADLAVFGQLHMLQSGPTPQATALIVARPSLVAYAQRVDAATGS